MFDIPVVEEVVVDVKFVRSHGFWPLGGFDFLVNRHQKRGYRLVSFQKRLGVLRLFLSENSIQGV